MNEHRYTMWANPELFSVKAFVYALYFVLLYDPVQNQTPFEDGALSLSLSPPPHVFLQ